MNNVLNYRTVFETRFTKKHHLVKRVMKMQKYQIYFLISPQITGNQIIPFFSRFIARESSSNDLD